VKLGGPGRGLAETERPGREDRLLRHLRLRNIHEHYALHVAPRDDGDLDAIQREDVVVPVRPVLVGRYDVGRPSRYVTLKSGMID
jgi:hypothetical protein